MGIRKSDFYEGAALRQLIKSDHSVAIEIDGSFFTINGTISIYIKYSTKGRTPWGFSFTTAERAAIAEQSAKRETVIAMVCGGDGIAAITFNDFFELVDRDGGGHVSCARKHDHHYKICGPNGELKRRIAPSQWPRVSNRNPAQCDIKTR